MISYSAAVEALYALGHELHAPRKFDLAHMRALCRALDDPQCRFRAVLIAGTNGKGSTAATLASILVASGQRTGLYTSPHLVRINERVCVNGQPIPDADFAAAYERVTEVAASLVAGGALPHPPSFFETMTAIAFEFFAASGVEIAILEAGMGGRLDATNVVEPILSVITDIDLDHQKFLGDTLAAIAREKAGILRPGIAAVTLPQQPEAEQAIGERIASLGARAVSAARNLPSLAGEAGSAPTPEKSAAAGDAFQTRLRLQVLDEEVEIASPLAGRHQVRNLALAITAAEELAALGYPITAQTIARGVHETRWPGRFQHFAAIAHRSQLLVPEIVVDVAHNPAGASALRSALGDHFGERPMVLLFAAMADKAVGEMAAILWPAMEHVVLTRVADNPRAASPAELARLAPPFGVACSVTTTVAEGVACALARARELGPRCVLVIAGSIYLAGEVLTLLADPIP